MGVKEFLSEHRKLADGPRRRNLATEISQFLVEKITSTQRNWPEANCRDLLSISHGIKNNPDYLDGLLSAAEFQLLLRSRLQIALERASQTCPARIVSTNGRECPVTVGDGKLLLENLEVDGFRYQVWDNLEENDEYIGKHLGQPNKHSSVWDDDVDRAPVQLQAIMLGRGRFRNRNRIDFVLETDQPIGCLKRTGESTSYVYVELVRHPLHTKKRICAYHGFPISHDEFQSF